MTDPFDSDRSPAAQEGEPGAVDPQPGVRRQARRPSRGQAMVEFALVVPLLLLVLVGVADMARVYTTMMTIESAAREAADFGSFSSSNWLGDPTDPDSNHAKTLAAMHERACIASHNLSDYVGTATTCENPALTVTLVESDGSAASGCSDPERTPSPCRVKAQLEYTFDLLAPIGIDFNGVRLGLPGSLTFSRESVFAISDFEIDNE